jgi:hypothetical protein
MLKELTTAVDRTQDVDLTVLEASHGVLRQVETHHILTLSVPSFQGACFQPAPLAAPAMAIKPKRHARSDRSARQLGKGVGALALTESMEISRPPSSTLRKSKRARNYIQ